VRYYEIEGKSVDEAINTFLIEKDIPKEFIEHEVLETGSKGFLGFGAKNAVVKVKFNDKEFLKRKSKVVLSELLEKAGFSDFSIEMIDKHNGLVLNVITKDSSVLIGKTAQTLDSIQFILEKMLGRFGLDTSSITVDVEGYRKRIIPQLKEKAVKLAKNVKKTGKAAKMPPMVTMVRKEIHISLKEISGISTISKGQGNVKELLIVPERKGRRRSTGRNNNRNNNNRNNNNNDSGEKDNA